MEILVVKWSFRTEALARAFEREIERWMCGVSKMTSPHFPGWAVVWGTYRFETTLRLVFHVEPEAVLPQPSSSTVK